MKNVINLKKRGDSRQLVGSEAGTRELWAYQVSLQYRLIAEKGMEH